MLRNRAIIFFIIIAIAGVIGYFVFKSFQQNASDATSGKVVASKEDGTFLLTIFLKHDQGKTLGEIQKKLNETGFYRNFPPAGTEIESWKVVMGVGQVVTLRVPANKLREVNVALEKMAWGSFTTEFYPTYDFLPIYKSFRDTTSKDTTNNILE